MGGDRDYFESLKVKAISSEEVRIFRMIARRIEALNSK